MSTVLSDVIGRGATGSKPAAGVAGRLYYDTTLSRLERDNGATWDVVEGSGGTGSITASGYTQATAKMLGRSTAATGAIEEITVGTGLSLSAGSLTATGGAAGALVFLEAKTASASATLDFTTAISATYDEYLFEFIQIIPASSSNLYMRMGTGVGPTWDAGANYNWTNYRWNVAGSAVESGAAQTFLAVNSTIDAVSTNANYGLNGSLRLFNPGGAIYKQISGQVTYLSTNIEGTVTNGVYLSTTAVTGIRFLMSSGNITSGIIRVYGIAKS